MPNILTDHHPRDWHWARMADAPKAVVATPNGHWIVAITENNPECGPCWVGVPAAQDHDGNWVQLPSAIATSCTVSNRTTTRIVARQQR